MNRRGFLKALVGGVMVAGGAQLIYASTIETNAYEVVEQEIPLAGLKPAMQNLRIAQISDLHMGQFVSRAQLRRVIDLILAQQPALTLITGDFLTIGGDYSRALDDLSAEMGRLSAHAPVMAVLGNHDDGRYKRDLLAVLRGQGVAVLENEFQAFEYGGERLYIAGLGSVFNGNWQLAEVVGFLPSDAPAILMVHEPDSVEYSASTGKFALQVSGHSHGGQIVLPFLGRLVLPWMGRKYPAGLYRVGSQWLYTNRGIGMVDVPMRYNCPPEITLMILKNG